MKRNLKGKLHILLETGRVTTQYAAEADFLSKEADRIVKKTTKQKVITFYGGSGFGDSAYHIWII